MSKNGAGCAVSALVSAILEARGSGRPTDPDGPAGSEMTIEEAYRVQAEVARRTGPVGGFKVANKPGAPRIMAPIFREDIRQSPALLVLPPREKIGIELEVGFRLDTALPARDHPDRRAAVADCLSAVAAIEIVRTRLPAEVPAAMKLADNQINGGLVLGAPVKDWQSKPLGEVRARLSLGDETVLDGAATVPGGDAFENFLVLEEMIGTHCGGLQPGQVVITGSLNGLPYVETGLAVRGEIADLGTVSADLERIV